jgi:TorA maturation chaperone TorD
MALYIYDDTWFKPNSSEGFMLDQSIKQYYAIADFCNLLAVLLRLPKEETIAMLVDGNVASQISEMSVDAGFNESQKEQILTSLGSIREQIKRDGIELSALRHAYTTIFTHPEMPLIFPYESQFLYWEANPNGSYDLAPRVFVSDAALDAERCYKKAGLTRSPDVNVPADHIATEIEFMGKLYSHKAELLERVELSTEECDRVDELIDEFSRIHFEKWGIRFFEKCAQTDVYPLYKTVGTLGVVLMERLLSISTLRH